MVSNAMRFDPKRGHDTRGFLHPKKHFEVDISTAWVAVAAIIFPPYVQPSSYYISANAVSGAVNLDKNQYIAWKGKYFTIDPNFDADGTGSPQNLVQQYAPEGEEEWGDTNTDGPIETEIPGHPEPGHMAKAYTVFQRERRLRLGSGLIVSASNSGVYHDSFSTRGKLSGRAPRIEDAKALVFSARVDEPSMASAWDDALTGGATDLSTLSDNLWSAFGNEYQGLEGIHGTASFPATAATNWLNKGRSVNDNTDQEDMSVNTYLSCSATVYQPKGARHLSGG